MYQDESKGSGSSHRRSSLSDFHFYVDLNTCRYFIMLQESFFKGLEVDPNPKDVIIEQERGV